MPQRRKETNIKIALKYNKIFEIANIQIRVVNWTSTSILLNNNILLHGTEKRKFRSRVNSPFAVKFFDKLYAIDNIIERDKLMKLLRNENNRIKSKEIWNRLPQSKKNERAKHMKNIRKLVDYSKIVFPAPWNKGKTKNCDMRLKRISENMTGVGNHMYGKTISDEAKSKQSISIKSKIKSGLFTPNIQNSRTHWESVFNGNKYRSSWEAIYASLNPEDLYEEIRLGYEYEGDTKIYMVDFVNHKKRTLTEIKPKEHTISRKNHAKFISAEKWCKKNQYSFVILTQEYFIENYDRIPFDKLQIPNLVDKLRRIQYEVNKQKNNT